VGGQRSEVSIPLLVPPPLGGDLMSWASKLVLIYHCSNRMSGGVTRIGFSGTCRSLCAYRVNIAEDHTCWNTCT